MRDDKKPMKNQLLKAILALAAICHSISQGYAQESLENSSWQLVAIHSFNDSVFTPEDPEKYLLRFRIENRLQIEADCNQAGATWNLDGETISFTGLVSTRKLCIAPSLFNRYIMILQQSEILNREGDTLILRSGNGVDWMEFEPYIYTPTF